LLALVCLLAAVRRHLLDVLLHGDLDLQPEVLVILCDVLLPLLDVGAVLGHLRELLRHPLLLLLEEFLPLAESLRGIAAWLLLKRLLSLLLVFLFLFKLVLCNDFLV